MRVCVIGHFAQGINVIDGQTIKTRNLFNGLLEINNLSLSYIDTYKWKKHPFKLLYKIYNVAKKNDALIMLPAHNGVKVFSSLLLTFKKKNTKLFYSVVGGWLPELLKKKKFLQKKLKKFNGIWVETLTMRNSMIKLGFENVSVVKNYKNLKPLLPYELVYQYSKPFSFCIFSRVCEEKGVTDAVLVFENLNKDGIKATLDIYGPIKKEYEVKFYDMLNKHNQYVSYKGIISSNKSVEIIKNYFMLLFPTKSYTEGIPGTILDAFFAGVPVLYSDWQSCDDILDKSLGVKFKFDDLNDFTDKLSYCIKYFPSINELKINCISIAQNYSSVVWQQSILLNIASS